MTFWRRGSCISKFIVDVTLSFGSRVLAQRQAVSLTGESRSTAQQAPPLWSRRPGMASAVALSDHVLLLHFQPAGSSTDCKKIRGAWLMLRRRNTAGRFCPVGGNNHRMFFVSFGVTA